MKAALLPVLLLLVLAFGAGPVSADGEGVVVDFLFPPSAVLEAGFEEGDVLVGWRRLPSPPANPRAASGELLSPFEWMWVELEQAPRGPVELIGRRGNKLLRKVVAAGDWGAEVRPVLSDEQLRLYWKGYDAVEGGLVAVGLKHWRALAQNAAARGDRRLAAWLELRRAQEWTAEEVWDEAEDAFQVALGHARDPLTRSVLLQERCTAAVERWDLEAAMEFCGKALEIRRSVWGLGPAALATQLQLVEIERSREEPPTENEAPSPLLAYQEILESTREKAPGSLLEFEILKSMGLLALRVGELERGREALEAAQELVAQIEPEGLREEVVLFGLGRLAELEGDLLQAESVYRQVFEKRHQPGVPVPMDALDWGNLGRVALERGHLALAEEHFRSALILRREWDPEGAETAELYEDLGEAFLAKGDLAQAEDVYESALSLRRKAGPEDQALTVMEQLVDLAIVRGDLERAAVLAQEGLETVRGPEIDGVIPEPLAEANWLRRLGEVKHLQSKFKPAGLFLQAARERYRGQPEEGVGLAHTLHNLGDLASAQGDRGAAASAYGEALALWRRIAPGTPFEARTLAAQAAMAADVEDLDRASTLYTATLEILEDPWGRAATFHAGLDSTARREIYRRALEVELHRDRPAAAFKLAERVRLYDELNAVASREVDLSTRLPAELDIERRRSAVLYGRALTALEESRGEALTEATQELKRLRAERARLAQEIRRTAPDAAAWLLPKALSVETLQSRLDPGTVVLAYILGPESSHLFVLDSDTGLEVFELPWAEGALRRQVDRFRQLLEKPVTLGGEALDLSSRLYRVLIAPAEERIATGKRLLILPDGPLHRLPFAALARSDGEGPWQALVAFQPLHFASSASAWARSKERSLDEERTLVRAFDGQLGAFEPWRFLEGPPLAVDLAVLPIRGKAGRENLIDLVQTLRTAGASAALAGLWPTEEPVFNELILHLQRYRLDGHSLEEAWRLVQLDGLYGALEVTGGDGKRLEGAAPWVWAGFQVFGE